MLKTTKPKKRISFTLEPDEYEALVRFARIEDRKIASAVKIIIMKHLRKFKT